MAVGGKHIIPSEVIQYQNEYGCNHSEYVATVENEKIYSLMQLDDNGFPIPMGLPLFVLVKENSCRIVSGEQALKLSDTLFVDE